MTSSALYNSQKTAKEPSEQSQALVFTKSRNSRSAIHQGNSKAARELELSWDREMSEFTPSLAANHTDLTPCGSMGPFSDELWINAYLGGRLNTIQIGSAFARNAMNSAPANDHPKRRRLYRQHFNVSNYAAIQASLLLQYKAIWDLRRMQVQEKLQDSYKKRRVNKEAPAGKAKEIRTQTQNNVETQHPAVHCLPSAMKELLTSLPPLKGQRKVLVAEDHFIIAKKELESWSCHLQPFRVSNLKLMTHEGLLSQMRSTKREELLPLQHESEAIGTSMRKQVEQQPGQIPGQHTLSTYLWQCNQKEFCFCNLVFLSEFTKTDRDVWEPHHGL